MKKLLLVLVALISLSAASQKIQTKKDQRKDMYVSASYSIGKQKTITDSDGNSTMQSFSDVTYPSVEVGYISKENISYGAIFGRGSFNGIGSKQDAISNYYWEAKISPSINIRKITLTGFIGTGAYIGTIHYFGEIGGAASYSINNYSYGVAYSNWDSAWYVTPFISYNF